jgi:hypothetical protein
LRGCSLAFESWASGDAVGSGLGGAFEFGDIELGHAHHGLHGAGVAEELGDVVRDDLPAEAELVLAPAAGDLFAALGEAGPVAVDLGLIGAVDDEEMASLKTCGGPPLKASRGWPSSSKGMTSGDWDSPGVKASLRRELGKMER